MQRTLIKGGRIVTAVDDYTGDILLEDGRIEAIGRRDPEIAIDIRVRPLARLDVPPRGRGEPVPSLVVAERLVARGLDAGEEVSRAVER